jgi:hypothetical protein
MSLKESQSTGVGDAGFVGDAGDSSVDDEGFKASELTISTCTVINNLNSKINLYYLTRFVDVFDQYDEELETPEGGIFNIEYYGNCARGENLIDKIKDEFSNQATIKFKYWGFRHINIKIFLNGKYPTLMYVDAHKLPPLEVFKKSPP